eukprot:426913-Prorocentrum_lima.AAC.1
MTSSLVGSEMCIRDSFRLSLSESKSRVDGTWVLKWKTVKKEVNGKQQWAVSYTHLTLPTICSV